MRVGNLGCKLLFLGSVAAISLLTNTADAASSPDPGSHGQPHSNITRVSSSHSDDRAPSAHRGGGSKSGRDGGMKSGAVVNGWLLDGAGRSGLHNAAFSAGRFGMASRFGRNAKAHVYFGNSQGGYGVIQCVAFARADTGIELTGNAVNWWENAAGRYERGNRPEPGSVLNFRSTGQMRLGHVSVVSSVVGSREILIDHSHWGGPGVARGVTVLDVSSENDWSEVRVSIGTTGEFGSVYPTFGFIYNRPDNGLRMASANTSAREAAPVEEVASAPAHASNNLTTISLRHGDDHDVFNRNSQ